MSTSIRVFLLDGHDVVRVGVRTLLRADKGQPRFEIVGEARAAADALSSLTQLRPDVLILDADLTDPTGRSGIEVIREMIAQLPKLRVLLLANDADEQMMSQAIVAGAAGYVLKHIEAASLVAGVRLVASGHTMFDPDAAAKVVRDVENRRRIYDSVADLTPQQTRILLLIAEGLSNKEIAQRLVLAEKTVKNHITGLLAKLNVSHRTQAALLATQLINDGVVPRPEPPAPVDERRPAPTPPARGPLRPGVAPVPPRPRRPGSQGAPGRSR